MSTIFILILFSLATIVTLLLVHIRKLKQEHDNTIKVLYDYLNQLNDQLKFVDEKVKFTTDFKESLSKAQTKLNKDIFELQMVLFDKKFKK